MPPLRCVVEGEVDIGATTHEEVQHAHMHTHLHAYMHTFAQSHTGVNALVSPGSHNPSSSRTSSSVGGAIATSKAVFLVTMPISFGALELSRSTYELLAKHVGMSLNSVSHWLNSTIASNC